MQPFLYPASSPKKKRKCDKELNVETGRFSKGQSAIEYLTTYGWMLLVIAIVGGAIFSTVQNSAQVQTTSGFQNADVQVEDFGVTDEGFQAELRAASREQIENVKIIINNSETGETVTKSVDSSVPVGSTETVKLESIESSETTNTYDVKITYDEGGLENLQAKGTITGNIEINKTWSTPHSSAPDCSKVSYDGSGTSSDPYEISNDYQLQCIGNSSAGVSMSDYYKLTMNIDASGTENWNSGKGFKPIALTYSNRFSGYFNGNGYSIRSLYIDRSSTGAVGLFGYASDSSSIRNISLLKGDIIGNEAVGGLIGHNWGNISNSSFKGNVKGAGGGEIGGLVGFNHGGYIAGSSTTGEVSGYNAGGLVGYHSGGNISNSYSMMRVNGSDIIGGLVGQSSGNISNSYATGYVTSGGEAGGLVGIQNGGIIKRSYSTGNVSGGSPSGGLVGLHQGGAKAIMSYSTGHVNSSSLAGGLIGHNKGSTISSSYAWGDVFGGSPAGGLVGYNDAATISSSYSTGEVSGDSLTGGLVGTGGGVSNSYWDNQTSNQGSSAGGTELTTSQMQGSSAKTNMDGFDFSDTWNTVSGNYPELAWQN